MANNELIIEIGYDGKSGLGKLKNDATKAGEAAGDVFGNSFAKTVGAVFSGNLLADALKKFVTLTKDFIKESVAQAVESEQAQLQLANSLKRVGGFTQENIEYFNSFANTLQKTTSVTDEQALSLVNIANNYARTAKQARELVQAGLDLQAATGVNAQSAIEALGNSLNGVSRGLGNLIPGFRVTGEEALKSGAALAFVNQQFGGRAQADYAGSAAGISKVSKGFAELQESLGRLITGSSEITGFLNGLGNLFFSIAKAIDSSGSAVDTFLSTLGTAARITVGIVTADLDKILNKTKEVDDVISGIDPDMEAFKQLDMLLGAEKFTAYSAGINMVKTDLDLAKEKLFAFGIDLAQVNTLTAEQANAVFNASVALQSYGLTIEPLNGLTALQVAEYQKLIETLTTLGLSYDQLSGKSLESLKSIQANALQLQAVIKSTLVNGVSSGIQSVVKALATGQSGFEAFKNMILNIIGDMAINVGTTLIGMGVAINALAASLATLSGGVAIAAGIALVAIGTLLKSAASSSASGSAMSGGGDFSSGGGIGPTQTSIEQQERQKPKTEVVVNVQGNVFNGREQAQVIAENLQEYFDTNAGVLVTS